MCTAHLIILNRGSLARKSLKEVIMYTVSMHGVTSIQNGHGELLHVASGFQMFPLSRCCAESSKQTLSSDAFSMLYYEHGNYMKGGVNRRSFGRLFCSACG